MKNTILVVLLLALASLAKADSMTVNFTEVPLQNGDSVTTQFESYGGLELQNVIFQTDSVLQSSAGSINGNPNPAWINWASGSASDVSISFQSLIGDYIYVFDFNGTQQTLFLLAPCGGTCINNLYLPGPSSAVEFWSPSLASVDSISFTEPQELVATPEPSVVVLIGVAMACLFSVNALRLLSRKP